MMARGQKMQQSLMSFVIQNFPIFFRGNWPFWRFTVIPFFLWMACYWIDDCDNIFLLSESIDSVILWAGFLLAFADICASCWCSVNAERDIPFVQVNCTDTFRSIYALLAMSVGLLAKWIGFGVNAVYLPIVLFFFFWDTRPKKSIQYFIASLVLVVLSLLINGDMLQSHLWFIATEDWLFMWLIASISYAIFRNLAFIISTHFSTKSIH